MWWKERETERAEERIGRERRERERGEKERRVAETVEEKGPRENSVFASWGGNEGTSKWSQRAEKEREGETRRVSRKKRRNGRGTRRAREKKRGRWNENDTRVEEDGCGEGEGRGGASERALSSTLHEWQRDRREKERGWDPREAR